MMLKPGLKGTHELKVTEAMLAKHVGSGGVSVYATPMMIAGMELVSEASVAKFLDEGYVTVGTEVNVRHMAATPEGMRVRFSSELTDVSENGKILTFRVEAYDEKELIGEGTHQRAVVNKERFEKKTRDKAL